MSESVSKRVNEREGVNAGKGPGGLDPCPFQQKNERALFRSALFIQKGCFPNVEKAWSQKSSGGFALDPTFSFSTMV